MALGKHPSPLWEDPLQKNRAGVPAMEVQLGALLVLLITTLLCGSIPLCVVRGAGRCNFDPKTRHMALRLMSGLAAGVFLATGLLDLLPGYLDTINEAFNRIDIKLNFPLPEFIMAMGFLLVLTLEQILLTLKDQSPGPSEEKRALLDFGVQSHHRDGDRYSLHHHHGWEELGGPGGAGFHLHVDFSSQSAIRAFVLVMSLSLHAVLEGVSVGVSLGVHGGGGMVFLALLLHRGLVSFSLALRLVQVSLRRSAVAGCVLLFALTTPLGVGLGLALAGAEPSAQYRLVRATLEGLAAGSFVYVTFIDILPQVLGAPGSRIPKVALLLTGFAAVTGVLFLKL